MARIDLGGAAAGGLSGAYAGSAFGPVGTAIGGAVGAGVGLFGKKKKKKRQSTLDPQQQKLYDEYIQSLRGEGPMSGLYNFDAEGANQNFDQNVSRPAYRNFQENIVPQITGQYRQNNLMNSSYSGEALSRAGRNVQEGLDAQRSNYMFQGQQNALEARRNAIPNVLQMNTQRDARPSTLDQILNSVGPYAGEYFADKINPARRTNPFQQNAGAIAPPGSTFGAA